MKYKLTFLSFISSISLCALTSPLALAATAQEEAPRWFEVEVILFKQLGDKKLLKEQFYDNVQLPLYDNYFDLLTPYLQPNIASLKQQLPQCESENNTVSDASYPKPFEIKSLIEIDELPTETLVVDTLLEMNSEQGVENSATNEVVTLNETATFEEENKSTSADETLTTSALVEEELQGLTAAQFELLNAAEKKFSKIQFIDTPQYPYFPKNELCLVNKDILQKTLISRSQSNAKAKVAEANAFPVQEVPTSINASGLRSDNHPYLINKDSLQLKDMITRLKWSKNFKPLLHLGWRQIGITRNKALPMKIFAGEHLEESYQKEVTEQLEKQNIYQQEQQTLLSVNEIENVNESESESDIQHQVQAGSHQENTLTPAQQNQVVKLKQLFESIALLDDKVLDKQNIEQLIATIDEQTMSDEANDEAYPLVPIKKPIQPWLLDGFLKVHLDHYLYITADFNLADDTLSSEQTEQAKQNKNTPTKQYLKTINFSQNKRVISGEVHYFDHPYIGMVVQIRRFDPTKPDDEAVTQAIR